MTHPYDAAYLQEIAETQGSLFERLQDTIPLADGLAFIRNYMKSDTRAYLDKGDVYLATLSTDDLMRHYQSVEAKPMETGRPLRGFAPNWMGQFYAQYQWRTGMPSREIVDRISPEWLAAAYPGLHDLDLGVAVEKVARAASSGCVKEAYA